MQGAAVVPAASELAFALPHAAASARLSSLRGAPPADLARGSAPSWCGAGWRAVPTALATSAAFAAITAARPRRAGGRRASARLARGGEEISGVLPSWLTLPVAGTDLGRRAAEAPPRLLSRKELRVPVLTEEELQRLELGHRVERKQIGDGGNGGGYVAVDVDAPAGVVLNCLADFERYAEVIPTVRDAKVHGRGRRADGEKWARCTYQLSKFRLQVGVVQSVDAQHNVVRFDIDPEAGGMVLKKASGFWLVEQLPGNSGRCRVWLGVDVVACKIVPRWLIDYAAERALRRATSWIKPHVEGLWESIQSKASPEPQAPGQLVYG